MNKCSKSECSNVVSDNRHALCQKCHEKERDVRFLAETNECATDGCANRVPKEYRFCRKCCAEYKARSQAAMEAAAKSRQVKTAQVAEDYLKRDLLAEFQAGKLRDGAKVTVTSGPLVSIAFAGKSYTICDREGEQRRAEKAHAEAEQKRLAEAEKIRRAEEEKARQAAEIATVFAQIKTDTLEDAIVDRSGKAINVLYDDGRVLSFDDPDVLAAEAQARKDAEAVSKAARKQAQKSKGKSESKQDGKKGKEQRKAA